MKSEQDLRQLLERIDHRGYPAYKETAGTYQCRTYQLVIDHVQGDPFASPSKISLIVDGKQASFPTESYAVAHRRIALQDLLTRTFYKEAEKYSFQAKGSGKSGLIQVSRPGQEILERSACQIRKDGTVVFHLAVGFPANGRTVNAGELAKILFTYLPACVRGALLAKAYPEEKIREVTNLADDQQSIREQLREQGLVAFVANGAILPRESGVSDRPMKGAVAFTSPSSCEVIMRLPHAGELRGMGIKKGITLIAGGGYHGKSTLLKALEMGVYPHIAGDGREYVITEDTAVKIRAEDGRSIRGTDISMFIRNLPNRKNTACFSTEDASGSTSQAANVIEAMEAGAETLLIDEDTSATNFMIRDELMQRVVNGEDEPITPFLDRVCELYRTFGISTVLVVGSCGAYFHRADQIIQMKNYHPADITEMAKEEAAHFPMPEQAQIPQAVLPDDSRCPAAAKNSDRVKIKVLGKDGFSLDHETVDLRYVEQIADVEQVAALGYLLHYANRKLFNGKNTMRQAADLLCKQMEKQGLESIYGGRYLPAGLAIPRKQELLACMNRYRKLKLQQNRN